MGRAPHLLLWTVLVVVGAAGSDQSGAWKTSATSTSQQAAEEAAQVTVPVCCGPDKVFNMSYMGCEPAVLPLDIPFHYEDGREAEERPAYTVQEGFPNCTFYSLQPEVEPDDAFFLLPDGSLKVPSNDGRLLPRDQFCLLATAARELEAIVCFPDATDSSFESVVYQTLYPVGLLVSAVFLAATLLVYCLVVELRDLLGRCFMCSILALCVAQLSTVVVQMGSHTLSSSACVILGVMMHFWYLAAFLWLNVICFNVFLTIWWKSDLTLGRVNRWFGLSSCYAWGLSLMVASVAVARDFSQGLQYSILPKPDFGQAKCWFSGDGALIMYFYGPTSVVLGLNVVLFCASAFRLCSLSKSSEARLFQFGLYLKLFVLMGVTWIFEVISFFVQRETNSMSSNYVWLVFDMINIMQGVVIFLVFVCRRAVLLRVCEVVCGQTFTRARFPAHYQEADLDMANNEIKHSVV